MVIYCYPNATFNHKSTKVIVTVKNCTPIYCIWQLTYDQTGNLSTKKLHVVSREHIMPTHLKMPQTIQWG